MIQEEHDGDDEAPQGIGMNIVGVIVNHPL
jgi:hypothetical protein